MLRSSYISPRTTHSYKYVAGKANSSAYIHRREERFCLSGMLIKMQISQAIAIYTLLEACFACIKD